MEEKKIVTVDLGTQHLGLSVASSTDDGKVEVLYYNEFPVAGISHGKVLNPTRLGAAIKSAIEKCEDVMALKIKEVIVNVQKYDIREISVESSVHIESGHCINAVDVENLESLIWSEAQACQNQGEDVFGIVPQAFDADSELNVNVKDITGMMADTLVGHYKAYIGKASYRNNIDAAFREAGIGVARAVFSPAETGCSVLTSPEMESGVALMDIGAGASSISIFLGGTLRHYGAIPFGGNNITADIANLCGIDSVLADNIKMGYGGLMPDKLSSLGEKTLKITDSVSGDKVEITAKYLSEIITARMKEIIEALLFEIQASGYSEKLKNGVVVCGGCANTLNICNLIKELSGYNARPGAPSQKLFTADKMFYSCSAATSAGLIAQSLGLDVNACTSEPEKEPEPEIIPIDSIFKEEDIREKGSNLLERLRRKEEARRKKAEEKAAKLKEEEERKRLDEEKKNALTDEQSGNENVNQNTSSLGKMVGKFTATLFGNMDDEDNKV